MNNENNKYIDGISSIRIKKIYGQNTLINNNIELFQTIIKLYILNIIANTAGRATFISNINHYTVYFCNFLYMKANIFHITRFII